MQTIQKRWTNAASVVATALLLEAVTQPAMAQQRQSESNEPICQIARYKPEISGPNREWIRLERCEDRLEIIHTRQGNENRGVLGVVNVVSDLIGPTAGFTRWYDHPVTQVAFRPDRCPNAAADNSANCTIIGTETLLLPTSIDIYSGQFTIEYADGELLRAITFRLPADVEWNEEEVSTRN